MAKIGRPLAMSVEDRRKEIYKAAEHLFGEHGFEHVSMSQIATFAGMSKKTLYVYFTDKRELLESLVMSSYDWLYVSQNLSNDDPVIDLQETLMMTARHVLSERHIRLCRLAIAERIGMQGLATTFYEKGIASSRDELIKCIQRIPDERILLQLNAESIADLLFGASIAKPFIDLLFSNQDIQIDQVCAHITLVIHNIFKTTDTVKVN